MRHWTRRFTLQYSKVGQALNASDSEISKDFLHENIRGILLAETSGLTSSEFAFVLATSGTTGAEGESIGNSWPFSHLVEAFSTQWGDAALAARDAKARKSEAVVAAVDNFDLSELSEAAARIENAISWNDTDPRLLSMKLMTMTTAKKALIGKLVTVMMSWMTLHTQLVLRQMTENFLNSLMAIWKTLIRPRLKCMHRQVAVFKKHVSFWLVSRVPEAIFLWLVLVLLVAWLSRPLIENLQSLVANARRVRGKENPFHSKVDNRQAWVHLAFCPNHRTHVSSLVLRCPRSVRLRLVQLVVDHITLLVFVF